MSPARPTKPSDTSKAKITKLPRLPKNVRIQKRPILRPSIPSPYTGADAQKVVYVSVRTPFVSAVKRIRKLLREIDKRSMSKVDLVNGKGSDREKLVKLSETSAPSPGKKSEEVVLKATNRAIEKVLGLALFFQGQDDCTVRLSTGSVGVVDDIVEVSRPMGNNEAEGEDEEEEPPESRVRKATVVEVAISLK